MHDAVMRTSASPQAPDCPIAPPSRESTYVRALHRACVVLGGVDRLASYLAVGEFELRAWMNGVNDPSEDVFLAVVEIILLNLEAPGPAT